MLKEFLAAAFALSLLALPASATTYNGNGATGFGGALGNSTLSVTSDSSGLISFVLNSGASLSDNVVIYIDSVTGGFADTSQFGDNADGGREAISGFNRTNPSRTIASFAGGFAADYAIDLTNGVANLFQLAAGTTDNSLIFVKGANYANPSTNQYTFNFNAPDIGLVANSGQLFRFVATLISGTAYRSNETIGSSTTTPGTSGDAPNAGYTGSTTYSNFATFVTVPEPSTNALLACGLLLAGIVTGRRVLEKNFTRLPNFVYSISKSAKNNRSFS